MASNLQLLKWTHDRRLEAHCLRRHRICNYCPGLVAYGFGSYPTRQPYYPTGQDRDLLDLYAENGVEVINLREAWSDISGYHGKDPLEPVHEPALRQMVEECHRRGLKIVPYVSPGYMDIHGPAYNPAWGRGVGRLTEMYEDLDHLCPGSPGHRAHFFANTDRLMAAYDFDGLYFDGGFRLSQPGCWNEQDDGHVHLWETASQSPEPPAAWAADPDVQRGFADLWGDFMHECYARIKRRGGMLVAHIGGDTPPPFQDRWWDYLLVGETIRDALASVEKTKSYDPYVMRFTDWSQLITDPEHHDLTPDLSRVPPMIHLTMASCIPYLQFPWLVGGVARSEAEVRGFPGVRWSGGWDHWTEWTKALEALGQPFLTTGLERDLHFAYLRLYRRMTADNTVVFQQVNTPGPLPFPTSAGPRRVSVFVNQSLWVAIGQLGPEERVPVGPLQGDTPPIAVTLPAGKLTVLRYWSPEALPEVILQ